MSIWYDIDYPPIIISPHLKECSFNSMDVKPIGKSFSNITASSFLIFVWLPHDAGKANKALLLRISGCGFQNTQLCPHSWFDVIKPKPRISISVDQLNTRLDLSI